MQWQFGGCTEHRKKKDPVCLSALVGVTACQTQDKIYAQFGKQQQAIFFYKRNLWLYLNNALKE